MNIALSKAVLPCILKAERRWNRCNMDFCSVSIHSVVSWANNLRYINHPMNVSFFSCSWKIQRQNLLATKGFDIKNILNWDSFQNYAMCFVFSRVIFSTFLRNSTGMWTGHNTPLPDHCPLPTCMFFYTQISFHLWIERWYPLTEGVKHLSYSLHCAFLPCSAIYLLSYTYTWVPCWMRATRKNVNILKPFWVNHEQLSPNIPYTVFKMCNWVMSASLSHMARFHSLVYEQSPMWLLMHVNAYVWLWNSLAMNFKRIKLHCVSTYWIWKWK